MATPISYSRDYLKGIPEQIKQQLIDNTVSRFIQDLRSAAANGKTSYLFVKDDDKAKDHACRTNQPLLTDADLIAGFCKRFPGCNIYYDESWVETNSNTRTLKKGIMIDWS